MKKKRGARRIKGKTIIEERGTESDERRPERDEVSGEDEVKRERLNIADRCWSRFFSTLPTCK